MGVVQQMRWALDLDGTITANPHFFQWWTYQLAKSGHEIVILTARNPGREKETEKELKKWDITYDQLCMMDEDMPRAYEAQGQWKLEMVVGGEIDVWVDNDFKIYEEVCGVDLSEYKGERIAI